MGWIGTATQTMAARRRQWRRARNLHAGARARTAGAVGYLAAGTLLAALGGAAVIAVHARQLGAATVEAGTSLPSSADALQPAIPGAAFVVPAGSAITLAVQGDAVLVVAAGMHAGAPVRVNLCSQVLDGARGRLLPLRIGYRFDDVARLVAAGQASGRVLALRNVALAGPGGAPMPQLVVSGLASADFGVPLQVAWHGAAARWASDAGPRASDAGSGALRRDGWLVWQDAALRLQRRASGACPGAGELVVELYRKGGGEAGRALVTAFPAHGPALTAWLRPGSYTVPLAPRASLEDQSLFQELAAHGLVRLGKGGLIELAPRDLAAWQAAPDGARAGELAGWEALARDPGALKLFKRLYRMSDGDYVREQVRIFNNERRLLAWRVRPGLAQAPWQASIGAAPLATGAGLPLVAERLFADVPSGWAPWTRVAAWPETDARAAARIGMALPHARGGERIELMLVGQVRAVDGARLLGQPRNACTGRACPSDGAAQLVTMETLPGAHRVELDVAPLEMAALAGAGDDRYRHLRVAGGRIIWRPLAANSGNIRPPEPAGVILYDRHGALVWSGGAPSPAARQAGLATLLGLRADAVNSVAGMLARVPAPGGAPHSARLTLDLALQRASQGALDCIGIRRGRWDGARCAGGQVAPAGRQGGIVIIDTDNGDVLAAAGAGSGQVDAANWSEVGSSRVDLQACKLEYSIVSPK